MYIYIYIYIYMYIPHVKRGKVLIKCSNGKYMNMYFDVLKTILQQSDEFVLGPEQTQSINDSSLL